MVDSSQNTKEQTPPRPQSPSNHHQDQGQLSTGSKNESRSPPLLLGVVQPQGEGKAESHPLRLPLMRKGGGAVKTANLHTGKTLTPLFAAPGSHLLNKCCLISELQGLI